MNKPANRGDIQYEVRQPSSISLDYVLFPIPKHGVLPLHLKILREKQKQNPTEANYIRILLPRGISSP